MGSKKLINSYQRGWLERPHFDHWPPHRANDPLVRPPNSAPLSASPGEEVCAEDYGCGLVQMQVDERRRLPDWLEAIGSRLEVILGHSCEKKRSKTWTTAITSHLPPRPPRLEVFSDMDVDSNGVIDRQERLGGETRRQERVSGSGSLCSH